MFICGFDLFGFPSRLEKAVIRRKPRLVAQLDIKFFFMANWILFYLQNKGLQG